MVSNLVVLEPKSQMQHSAWAKPYVKDLFYYEEEDGQTPARERESAMAALESWRARSGIQVDGVMSYDEFGVSLASHLGSALGFPCNLPRSIVRLNDKYTFRKACLEHGIPFVRFASVGSNDEVESVLRDPTWKYPLVLKPRHGAGSWCVRRVNAPEDLKGIWRFSHDLMAHTNLPPERQSSGFIVEEFFDGCEVDIDGWAVDSRVQFCQISDNNPPIEPFFLETGGTYPTRLPKEAKRALLRLTEDVFRAFPGINSCFHFEARIREVQREDGSKDYICMPLELNCRVGGAECPASVEATTGYNLAQVSSCIALGQPDAAHRGDPKHKIVCSTNLHPTEEGELVELSSKHVKFDECKVVDLTLFHTSLGNQFTLNELNGSSTSLGWISCGGESYDEARYNLKRATRDVVARFK